MNWPNANKMMFHSSKSYVLPISNAIHGPQNDDSFIYTADICPISCKELEKGLGIHIQGKLYWAQHCNELHSKAYQQLGLLMQICHITKNTDKRRSNPSTVKWCGTPPPKP